jgi:hypothetical protein
MMGAALQVPQDPVAKHQLLEQPKGSLDPAFAHGHFQRAVAEAPSTHRAETVSILATPEGHRSSPATHRPSGRDHIAQKKNTPQGSGPRGVETESANRLNLR